MDSFGSGTARSNVSLTPGGRKRAGKEKLLSEQKLQNQEGSAPRGSVRVGVGSAVRFGPTVEDEMFCLDPELQHVRMKQVKHQNTPNPTELNCGK